MFDLLPHVEHEAEKFFYAKHVARFAVRLKEADDAGTTDLLFRVRQEHVADVLKVRLSSNGTLHP